MGSTTRKNVLIAEWPRLRLTANSDGDCSMKAARPRR